MTSRSLPLRLPSVSRVGTRFSARGTGETDGDWVPHTLVADQSMLLGSCNVMKMNLNHGSRRKLVGTLMLGVAGIALVVELFVRLVLNPTFERPAEFATNMFDAARRSRQETPQPLWSFTGQGVTSGLSDQAFQEFQCFLTWLVCVVTGLGSEFFVGYEFLTTVETISRKHEHAWFVAQFLFSLSILMAILLARSGNPLALGFGVAGAWKFGFPETILCIISGWQCPNLAGKLSGLLNAFGTLAHHSALLLFISLFTLGVSPLTRPLVAGSMPLVLQHIVISVKYISPTLYIVLELLLEIWWEWEVFSVIEFAYLPHGVQLPQFAQNPLYSQVVPRCVCTMVLAHWMYWSAGILGVISQSQLRSIEQKKCNDLECCAEVDRPQNWQGNELAEWREQLAEYDPDAGGRAQTQASQAQCKCAHETEAQSRATRSTEAQPSAATRSSGAQSASGQLQVASEEVQGV